MKAHLVVLASVTLAFTACAASPTADGVASSSTMPPAAGVTTTPPMLADSCKADAAQQYVGKVATAEIIEQARVAANAKTARMLTPDMMVTMEYRGDRLNVRVGTDKVIGSINCG